MKPLYALTAMLLIILAAPGAYPLEDNYYFSVPKNGSYSCIYLNLPQDLDVNSVNSPVNSLIKSDKMLSPWIETTETQITINPGMLRREPVCFYHEGKSEGDYSLYRMSVSANDLSVKKDVKGGICITGYKDFDTSSENTTSETNICDLLNNNADIFDAQFRHPYIEAKPGEIIKNSVYVTSYAKIRIDFDIETDITNDLDPWITAANPDEPIITKSFSVKAPSTQGTYDMIIKGSILGCDLELCKKTTIARIKVDQDAERNGFVINSIPKNINVKDSSDVNLKLLITNYEDEMNFSVSASADPGMKITPEKKTVKIDKNSFTTIEFTATPASSDYTSYVITFDVLSSTNEEHIAKSYISFGELLTDAKREADDIIRTAKENDDKETETFVLEKLDEWEEEREELDYGEELATYEDFKKSLEEAKKGNIEKNDDDEDDDEKDDEREITNGGSVNEGGDKTPEGGFDWFFIIIIVVVAIAAGSAFFIYKKTQNVSEKYDYPEFEE